MADLPKIVAFIERWATDHAKETALLACSPPMSQSVWQLAKAVERGDFETMDGRDEGDAPIYAQHPHFMAAVALHEARDKIGSAIRQLKQNHETLAAADIRFAMEKMIRVVEGLVRPRRG